MSEVGIVLHHPLPCTHTRLTLPSVCSPKKLDWSRCPGVDARWADLLHPDSWEKIAGRTPPPPPTPPSPTHHLLSNSSKSQTQKNGRGRGVTVGIPVLGSRLPLLPLDAGQIQSSHCQQEFNIHFHSENSVAQIAQNSTLYSHSSLFWPTSDRPLNVAEVSRGSQLPLQIKRKKVQG